MQGVRRVLDIRVGEPKKIGLVSGRDLHAFVQRPELSCPARSELSCGMNFHALRSTGFVGSFLRESGGTLLAVCINIESREISRSILPCARQVGLCDRLHFVAPGSAGAETTSICQRL